MTTASWPCRVSCSQTRRTELVTPLTCGRKDSLMIATRTGAACPHPGAVPPDYGRRSAEPVAKWRRPPPGPSRRIQGPWERGMTLATTAATTAELLADGIEDPWPGAEA